MRSLVFAIAALLVGCVAVAPTDSYRPRGSNADAWVISGQYNQLTGELVITIDGTEVIKDSVSAWDGSGEFSGEYRGEKITVSCNYIMKILSSYEQCMVFVGSERAAALQF